MSLGGYKFAGRYCQKGSLTDQQWALLVHKTRLAAFMAANTVANAGWSFDQTGGDISFGSYGNVIYSLGSANMNYVSFVKHGTESSTYIAIVTAFSWSNSGSSDISLITCLATVSSDLIGAGCTVFHRISTVRLDTLNLFTGNLNGAVPMLPTALSVNKYQGYSGPAYAPTCYLYQTSVYTGYAIKGNSIVTFISHDISTTNNGYFSMLSGDAFSSRVISESTDRILAMCPFSITSSTSTSLGEGSTTSSTLNNGIAFVTVNGAWSFANARSTHEAMFYSSGSELTYPFESLSFYSIRANSYLYGVGRCNIDFACTNRCNMSGGDRTSIIANGNLILASRDASASTNTGEFFYVTNLDSMYSRLYVGWDPSNPDITQASAWQLYDET